MKRILVIGAGRSASSLIKYLLDHSETLDWKVTVADISIDLAKDKTGVHPNGRAIAFDIHNVTQRETEISGSDIVVSMLPAFMHLDVAKDCLRYKKHLVTASYVSPQMAEMKAEVEKAGILFLNECGLDPGIDHMSAMKIIDQEKSEGAEILAFHSYCGGLVAPESNDNPWEYKFTWNPRNVVLAGQGGSAQYVENGEMKSIPYEHLFEETKLIRVNGFGDFEAYANRDSLSYRSPYGLENILTMLRGTLRMPGYCKAWNTLIQLGLTDDTTVIADLNKMTWSQFMKTKTASNAWTDKGVAGKIEWLGIFSDKKIDTRAQTPAQALQYLLEEKWMLNDSDKDMVVMQHEFETRNNGKKKKLISSLVVKGKDSSHTAMAMTVGLPLAIAVKNILLKKTDLKGIQIPVKKEIYLPVLKELEEYGIVFREYSEEI